MRHFPGRRRVRATWLASDSEILASLTTVEEKFGEGAYAEIALDGSALAAAIPSEFVVGSAYPNPFNSTVTIPFTLPSEGEVQVAVFNVLGQKVFEKAQPGCAGQNVFTFNAAFTGGKLVSGLYFLQLQYLDQVRTLKLMLIR